MKITPMSECILALLNNAEDVDATCLTKPPGLTVQFIRDSISCSECWSHSSTSRDCTCDIPAILRSLEAAKMVQVDKDGHWSFCSNVVAMGQGTYMIDPDLDTHEDHYL